MKNIIRTAGFCPYWPRCLCSPLFLSFLPLSPLQWEPSSISLWPCSLCSPGSSLWTPSLICSLLPLRRTLWFLAECHSDYSLKIISSHPYWCLDYGSLTSLRYSIYPLWEEQHPCFSPPFLHLLYYGLTPPNQASVLLLKTIPTLHRLCKALLDSFSCWVVVVVSSSSSYWVFPKFWLEWFPPVRDWRCAHCLRTAQCFSSSPLRAAPGTNFHSGRFRFRVPSRNTFVLGVLFCLAEPFDSWYSLLKLRDSYYLSLMILRSISTNYFESPAPHSPSWSL